MKTFIGIIGLTAFASMFIGTALGIVLSGFVMGFKILFASALVLAFALILDDMG